MINFSLDLQTLVSYHASIDENNNPLSNPIIGNDLLKLFIYLFFADTKMNYILTISCSETGPMDL